jgi:hypothetical protein
MNCRRLHSLTKPNEKIAPALGEAKPALEKLAGYVRA